ncbi:MAG: type II and III secretion system protein, partial [Pirellulales bacterium]|nr:type II and III secretion system protein [Pirellulales bacterium]
VIIGGLIREEASHNHSSVPGLSKFPFLGRLFQKRTNESRRDELVVALVTHVIPDACGPRYQEINELDQTLPDYAAYELTHPQLPTTIVRQGDHDHDGGVPPAVSSVGRRTAIHAPASP